jgi:hypothetical protein
VRIRRHEARAVVADLDLARDGRTWCRIDGWEDRRFDTDARLWPVMLFPEENLLAEPRSGGWVAFEDRYRAAPTRDQLARRFLGERERAEYEAQPPRTQRAWLAARIAAKDAVRDLLWRRGHGKLFPVEIALDADLRVTAPVADVRVAVAQHGELTAALAAVGRDPKITFESADRLLIDGSRVDFRREGGHVVAWAQ